MIHRAAVLFDTPQASAAWRTVSALGSSTGGRLSRGEAVMMTLLALH